jgi:hypothetical protein
VSEWLRKLEISSQLQESMVGLVRIAPLGKP